jgi:predicted transcriptional regulator
MVRMKNASVRISSEVEVAVWQELGEFAAQSHQSISCLLTEAIRDYLRRRHISSEIMDHLEQSIEDNRDLGSRLAE